ncbi:MAG: aspartate/glutamate racemase family protein [Ignavibacteriae bacterium]|nr:aspartate/glutamate racemase family protein [Ignavibacteriota bacterium]MCB9210343.1 aspartate/glutamate racemase family protein [Ignavibacteriales bacterium]MCB9259730.1 aspartate/glutamate racemase family protein [Ignavibacteriales bacterium]
MDLSNLENKDHLKIIITDSGLGGLSVHALLDKRLSEKNKNAELIFFNSLAHSNFGYNSMLEKSDKLNVFNSALEGMLKFNPDLILIACNTLSVLYHETKISKEIKIPVIGIVENGIDLILENLINHQDANILILGTETTINSDQHKKDLIKSGIEENIIYSQSCKNLESEIQNDANSPAVEKLINFYLSEAFNKIKNKNVHQLVLLACTHYGYSKNIFEKQLFEFCGNNFTILNPNEKMSEMLNGNSLHPMKKCIIKNRVLSRVEISNEQISNLAKLLEKDSITVSHALKNYEYKSDLFEFDKMNIRVK